jgi:hypothetical protein
MKLMKPLLAGLAAMIVASGFALSAQATLISGMLNISGTAQYDKPIAHTFDLLGSTIVFQSSDGILITGSGIVMGNGFEPTPIDWSFSQQRGHGTVLTFSATNETAVPDGGMTLTLLGASLVGLAALRAKFAKV